ncbi:MAG TPA: DUF3426 domain-containing protein [Alphaproteobacteria bacterium]|nr:DUF3426 domain-containing protein [Alphaproteobacteria bacterium]
MDEAPPAPDEVAFEDAAPEPDRAETPELAAAPEPKMEREKKPRRAASRLSRAAVWFAFVFLVGAILGGAYQFRQVVVDEWPAATGVYEAVGIPVVPPPGYSFNIAREKLQLEFQGDGVGRRLVVRGEIRNISSRPRPTPRIMVFLQNDANKELKRHDFPVGQDTVAPGESAKFTTRIDNPPVAATKIRLSMRYPVARGSGADRRARPFKVKK